MVVSNAGIDCLLSVEGLIILFVLTLFPCVLGAIVQPSVVVDSVCDGNVIHVMGSSEYLSVGVNAKAVLILQTADTRTAVWLVVVMTALIDVRCAFVELVTLVVGRWTGKVWTQAVYLSWGEKFVRVRLNAFLYFYF